MAPYVFQVTIVNQSAQNDVEWVGHSKYSPLDGKTTVDYRPIVPRGRTETMTITKGGGTDGLFSAISWDVRDGSSLKTQFAIYCRMPASAGESASVDLVNTQGMSQPQFDQSGPDRPANNYENDKAHGWNDRFISLHVSNGARIELRREELDYPHSSCSVIITDV